ncbi:MAG TPA: YwqG family protein [Verrucomicrobiae bacterium]
MAETGLHLQKQFEIVEVEPKPAFGLFKKSARKKHVGLKANPGSSRLGGLPDVTAHFSWPHIDGKPMQFLAQINCSEVAGLLPESSFPTAGLLHFFFDFDNLNCFKPQKNRTAECVQYSPAITDLVTASAPAGTKPEFILPAFPVKLVPCPTFPDAESEQYRGLKLSEDEREGFSEGRAIWQKQYLTADGCDGLHQVAGIPEGIQGDIFIKAEKIYRRTEGNTNSEASEKTLEESGNWCLLLQCDSDGDLGTEWGDAGTLYFCIRKVDLHARHFEKVCVVFQCH